MSVCAICQEPMVPFEDSVLRTAILVHEGWVLHGQPYDHAAVRQRDEPQPYEPYDPAEQDYGPGVPRPEPFSDDDVPVTSVASKDVTNPYVELVGGDTVTDYKKHHEGDSAIPQVKVRAKTRLFFVYLAGLCVFLVVATVLFAGLKQTPWDQSWWTCLALTVLFRTFVMFSRWSFNGRVHEIR